MLRIVIMNYELCFHCAPVLRLSILCQEIAHLTSSKPQSSAASSSVSENVFEGPRIKLSEHGISYGISP
jgi:hypothetical protein